MGLKKLEVTDRFLTPKYFIKLEFKGKGIDKSFRVIPDIAKKVFGIASKDWAEPSFKWDMTDKATRGFFVQWESTVKPAVKTKDRWTSGKLNLTMQGSFSTSDGSGSFVLLIIPAITTKFMYSNSLQRILYDIYSKMFYDQQRRKYVDYFKLKLNDFINELKEIYGQTLQQIEE